MFIPSWIPFSGPLSRKARKRSATARPVQLGYGRRATRSFRRPPPAGVIQARSNAMRQLFSWSVASAILLCCNNSAKAAFTVLDGTAEAQVVIESGSTHQSYNFGPISTVPSPAYLLNNMQLNAYGLQSTITALGLTTGDSSISRTDGTIQISAAGSAPSGTILQVLLQAEGQYAYSLPPDTLGNVVANFTVTGTLAPGDTVAIGAVGNGFHLFDPGEPFISLAPSFPSPITTPGAFSYTVSLPLYSQPHPFAGIFVGGEFGTSVSLAVTITRGGGDGATTVDLDPGLTAEAFSSAPSAIPEPTTLTVWLLLGLAGVVCLPRRGPAKA